MSFGALGLRSIIEVKRKEISIFKTKDLLDCV